MSEHRAARPEPPPSPQEFRSLERRVRVLERYVYALVATIALAAPTVASFIDIRNARLDTVRAARHTAHGLETFMLAAGSIQVAHVREALRREMVDDRTGFMRVIGDDGREIARVGDDSGWRFTPTAIVPLPPWASPLRELQVGANEAALLREIARVFAIHILVGGVIGLAVYQLPIRALENALWQLERAHAGFLHASRLAALGELSAHVAHEVNNPLGIVLARVRLILSAAREKKIDPETVKDLEVIEKHGTRIGVIVRGLLAFGRRPSLERRDANLNHLAREILQVVERPFAKLGVRFETDFAADLPVVEASPEHLQQILLNLLNNARDAMASGGTVTLRTRARGDEVHLEVQDTGTGLAPEARQRLFEPFFTTKEIGKGTGLGLSVSYGIAQAHGGSLEAEDVPGGGALFRLRLPRQAGWGEAGSDEGTSDQ